MYKNRPSSDACESITRNVSDSWALLFPFCAQLAIINLPLTKLGGLFWVASTSDSSVARLTYDERICRLIATQNVADSIGIRKCNNLLAAVGEVRRRPPGGSTAQRRVVSVST